MSTTAVDFEFDPYSLGVQENPYPYYKVLRDSYPAYWSDKGRCWALSRYADVMAAVSDATRFSSAKGNILDDDAARAGKTLGTSDPPKHDQLRALVNAAFMRGRVEQREPEIRETVNTCMAPFFERGGGDLIQELTTRISCHTICGMLGFEHADHMKIKSWIDGVVYRDPVTRTIPESGLAARKAIVEYTDAAIALRRREPRGDLITALIQAEVEGRSLTDQDLRFTISTLLAAGIESASSFIGNAMLALTEHPDQMRLLESDLSLAPNVIEEMLRYDTPTQRFHRTAVADIELHGQIIKAGQSVLVMYGAANRDERQFPDPDRFDLNRPPARHLGLGHSIHFCLGANLARTISRIFLEEWFAHGRQVSILRERVVRMHSPTFRGLTSMPVKLH